MYKLLLVEDYPVIQNMYAQVLKQNDFEVDIADDGKDALKKVKGKEYDVILLDMLLPQVNGVKFLEDFKDRPAKTKIFALSDFDYPDIVKKAFALGVSKYWIKVENTPYVLAEKLKKILNGEHVEETSTSAVAPKADKD